MQAATPRAPDGALPVERPTLAQGIRRGHRGVFTIPVTPFADDGTLDLDSLRRVVAFCVETGAHGLVAPVNVSEFTTLSPMERRLLVRTMVEENARCGGQGRVPVVAGVGAPTTAEAVRYAQEAEDAGADAIIAMPAYDPPPDEQGCYDFYAALDRAVRLPIYIQNHEPLGDGPHRRPGTVMSPELLARMLREIKGVQYVKEESAQTGPKIVRALELAGEACRGIMGGKAGRFLFDEYRRGACGTMPACEVNDLHVQLWNLLDGGNVAGARLLMQVMLPLLDFEELFGPAVCKEVLYRRRLIASPYQRWPGPRLDRYALEEIDQLLAAIAPWFTRPTPIDRPG
jgi:dihydrodipicolinate synthase/N-acetylneuraminate lyase